MKQPPQPSLKMNHNQQLSLDFYPILIERLIVTEPSVPSGRNKTKEDSHQLRVAKYLYSVTNMNCETGFES